MQFKKRPSNNIFLKISNGESVKLVFRGEPFDFHTHWGKEGTNVCKGEGCVFCKEGKKKTFRFRLNAVLSENGTYVGKIFEGGGTTYDALQSLAEEGVDLEKTVIKITRQGDGLGTKYMVMALPGPVNLDLFKDLPLHDITKFNDSGEGEDDASPTDFDLTGQPVPF